MSAARTTRSFQDENMNEFVLDVMRACREIRLALEGSPV
jgi:hypothetical protein